MFRVVEGAVRLFYLNEDGQEFVHNIYMPRDWFGVSTLIDGEPRAQMAQAQTDVVLDILSSQSFEAFRNLDPAFDRALMRWLSRDVRLLINRVNSVVFEPLPSRLAWRIVKAAAQTESGELIAKMSQSDLAAMVDASRQRVNTILGEFQSEGLVELNYGFIKILDRTRLASRISKP